MAKFDKNNIREIANRLAKELTEAFEKMSAVDTTQVVTKLGNVAAAASAIGDGLSKSRRSMISDLRAITREANITYSVLRDIGKAPTKTDNLENSSSENRKTQNKKGAGQKAKISDPNIGFLRKEITSAKNQVYGAYSGQEINSNLTDFNEEINKTVKSIKDGSIDVEQALKDIRGATETALTGQFDGIKQELQDFANGKNLELDPKVAKSYEKLNKALSENAISYKKARSEFEKLKTAQSVAEKINAQQITGFSDLKKQISIFESTKGSSPVKANLATLKNQIDTGAISFEDAQNQFAQLQSQVIKSKSVMDLFSSSTMQALGKIIALGSAAKTFQIMYNYVKDIDNAMTELKKVTEETDSAYSDFLERASSRTQTLGVTLTNYINATSEFARLGYSLSQSEELAEAAVLYNNVGDGVKSVSDGAGSIISTMKAFGEESYSAMQIVDKFNKIGNEFAITSGGIGDALTRSASALAQAGNSLEESIALIATANTIIRNEETVGTALKTMSLRLGKTQAQLEELEEDSSYALDSKSAYRDTVLAATRKTSAPVDIMLDDGQYKSTYEILKDISEVWDEIDQKTQNSLLYTLGGLRQSNVLSAIIENFDIAKEALESASDADGSALAENEKYLDSIQGKTDKLKASVEELSNDVLSSGLAKMFLDGANIATSTIDNVVKLNSGLGNTLSLITAIRAFSGKTNFVGSIGNIFKYRGKYNFSNPSVFNPDKTKAKAGYGSYRDNFQSLLTGDSLVTTKGWDEFEKSLNDATVGMGDFNKIVQQVISSSKSRFTQSEQTEKDNTKAVSGAITALNGAAASSADRNMLSSLIGRIKNIGIQTLSVWAVTATITAVYDKIEYAVKAHERLNDEINEGKNRLEGLQSEYDNLNQKELRSETEEKRLLYLKKQIARLEEENRKNEAQYAYEEYTDRTNWFTRSFFDKEKTRLDEITDSIDNAVQARYSKVREYAEQDAFGTQFTIEPKVRLSQFSDEELADVYDKQVDRYQEATKAILDLEDAMEAYDFSDTQRNELNNRLETLKTQASELETVIKDMELTGRIELEFFNTSGKAAKTFGDEIKSWNNLKLPIIDDFKEVLDSGLFNKSKEAIEAYYDYFENGGTDLADANNKLADSIKSLSGSEQDRVKQAVDDYNTVLASVNDSVGISRISDDIDKTRSALKQLESASNEYAQYGRLSLQTLQEIAQLEPKYIALLVDENGQLNLNTQSVRNLQQARIDEMRVSILQATTQRINRIASERDALGKLTQMTSLRTNATLGMAEAELKRRAATAILSGGRQAKLTKEYLKQAKAQMVAINGFGGVSNAIDRTTDANDKAQKAAEKATDALKAQGQGVLDALEKQKEKLQDDLDALNDKYDAEDKEFELQKKIIAYQQAMANKTVRVYTHEDGWVYQSDATAIKNARDELTEYQKELQRDETKQAIQDQIDAIDALREKISDSMSLIGTELDDYNNKMRAMNDAMGKSVEDLNAWADAYNEQVIGALTNSEDSLGNMTSSLNDSAISLGGYFAGIGDQIQDIIDWIEKFEEENGALKQNLEEAGIDLSGIDELYKNGKISLEEYTAALQNLNKVWDNQNFFVDQTTGKEIANSSYVREAAEAQGIKYVPNIDMDAFKSAIQQAVDAISTGKVNIETKAEELSSSVYAIAIKATEDTNETVTEGTNITTETINTATEQAEETLNGFSNGVSNNLDTVKGKLDGNQSAWNDWSNNIAKNGMLAAATIESLSNSNVTTGIVAKNMEVARNRRIREIQKNLARQPKMHSGGLVEGITRETKVSDEFRKYMSRLERNEVPIIRQAGEWVLTRAQQRKIMDYSDLASRSRNLALSIGDIVINSPVGNVDDLSKAIINKLPAAIMRNFG